MLVSVTTSERRQPLAMTQTMERSGPAFSRLEAAAPVLPRWQQANPHQEQCGGAPQGRRAKSSTPRTAISRQAGCRDSWLDSDSSPVARCSASAIAAAAVEDGESQVSVGDLLQVPCVQSGHQVAQVHAAGHRQQR